MLKDEVMTFFSTFFDSNFDTGILEAFCICFSLMLVYGVLIRPWLNICGGSKL